MKKSFITITFLISCFALLIVLNNLEQDKKENHLKVLNNHPFNSSLELSKDERLARGIPPNKYFEEKYLLEINPATGRTHPENIYNVQQSLKKKKLLQQRTPGDGIDNQWVERGPSNVAGRTRVVMFDPNDVTNKTVTVIAKSMFIRLR